MSLQDTNSFCVFCYKAINYAVHTNGSADSVKKFIKIMDRYVGRIRDNNLLMQKCAKENVVELLFKCCKECNKTVNEFCETFHKMKLLELQLDLKLDNLVGKLEHANRVPTRWIHLNKVLDETFSRDLITREQSQNVIREMRQNIVKAAEHRFRKSQPRVLVKHSAVVQPVIQLGSCLNSDLTDEDTDDCISQNEDTRSDVEEYEQENNLYSDSVFREGTEKSIDGEIHPRNDSPVYNIALFKERQFISPNDNVENTEAFTRSSVEQMAAKQGKIKNTDKTSLANKYPCKNCKTTFPGLAQLRRHINMKLCQKRKENGTGDWICRECGKTFTSLCFLTYHLEFHKNPEEGKWECGECGKKCSTKFSLNIHFRKHTKDKPYVCRFCGKRYGYNVSLKGHLSEKHGNEKGVEKVRKKYVPKSSKHVKRTICPVEKKRKFLKKVGKFEYEINKEKKFSRCKDCRKAFSSFKALKKHINCKLCLKKEKGCGGKPKCGDCGDVFNLDKELWVHQSDVHEDKVCLECGKQFKMTQNFKLHLEYHKDPKEWKFECEKCGRKCVSKYKLKEHSVKCIKSRRKKVL